MDTFRKAVSPSFGLSRTVDFPYEDVGTSNDTTAVKAIEDVGIDKHFATAEAKVEE
jgi:hypothetical protein